MSSTTGSVTTTSSKSSGAGGGCTTNYDCYELAAHMQLDAECNIGICTAGGECILKTMNEGTYCANGIGRCGKWPVDPTKIACVRPRKDDVCLPPTTFGLHLCDPSKGIIGPGICDDGDPCTADFCDQSTSVCQHWTEGDGTACNAFGQCKWGACCINDIPKCDDPNSSNTPPSALLCKGAPPGTVCTGSFGGGQCFANQCCTP